MNKLQSFCLLNNQGINRPPNSRNILQRYLLDVNGGGGDAPFTVTFDTPGMTTWTSPVTGNVLVWGLTSGQPGTVSGLGNPGASGLGATWGQSVIPVVKDVVYDVQVGEATLSPETYFIDQSTFWLSYSEESIADTVNLGGNPGAPGAIDAGGAGAAGSALGVGANGADADDISPAAGGVGVGGSGSGGAGGYPGTAGGDGQAPGGGGGGEAASGSHGFGTGATGKLVISYPV